MNSLSPFARAIVEQRKRRNMSRSQLAERSELSYPYVSQLETGLRKPSRKAADALASALGISVEDLERTIPRNDDDLLQLREAEMFSEHLTGGPSSPIMASPVVRAVAIQPAGGSPEPGSKEDLIADIIDILEEFESGERLDVLAEVQKRAMQRMLDEGTGR